MARDRDDEPTPREALLTLLLAKVSADTYPSSTMLDIIEGLLTPDDVPSYVGVLMQKIQDDTYPSNSLIKRAMQVAGH